MARTPPVVDDFESIDEETLRRKIADLAYHKAEQRGFEPGHEYEDWLEAEREIRLGRGLL